MNEEVIFQADQDEATSPDMDQPRKHTNIMLTLIVRLPSILLADLILLHSEFLLGKFTAKLEPNFNPLVRSIMAKTFLLLCLFICAQIFILKLRYALNIYKCLALISLPSLFCPFINWIRQNPMEIFFFTLHPPIINSIIYSVMFTFTTLLYSDIHSECITDLAQDHSRIEEMQSQVNMNKF